MSEIVHKPASLQAFMRSGDVQKRIDELLKDRAPQFTTSLMSVINQNVMLQDCEPWSVLTAAITAASLDLPIEPSLGYADILPYWDNSDKAKAANGGRSIQKAQFQMRAKGFKQLALRSGHYRTVNVTEVRKGEYKGKNHLTGEYDFKWFKKDDTRLTKEIIGYVAYIELNSGFRKSLYMTVDELEAHAKRYSKQYKAGGGQWADKHPTKLKTGFDNMSRKTVMKLLIAQDGITSTQMQTALRADQAVANSDDTYEYVDNDKDTKKTDDTDQTNHNANDGVDETPTDE